MKAFIGVLFNTDIIFNVVKHEGEFKHTGLSIINSLKLNKNKFIADVIRSCNYECISRVYDNEFVYSKNVKEMSNNINMDSFASFHSMMAVEEEILHFYVYDVKKDVIYIKTPELNNIVALEYLNNKDVREIINKLI